MSNAKWVIYKDSLNDYRFKLVAHSGEILVISVSYPTRQHCYDNIETVKAYATANIPTIDQTGLDKDKTRIAGQLND